MEMTNRRALEKITLFANFPGEMLDKLSDKVTFRSIAAG